MLALALLAACSHKEDKVLSELDGWWAGQASPDTGPYGATAHFDWDGELLTGEVVVTEPDATHTYAVRRWDVFDGDTIDLNLTDLTDGTRGLQLTGSVKGSYSGKATVRYPCPEGTCGWEGPFDLAAAAPTTGGSGATPTSPTGTTPTTTTGGTGATTR
jgi:hypothetical protein